MTQVSDTPVIVQVMNQFKAHLLASEAQQTQQMVAQWRSVESTLQDKVELFARRVLEDGLSPSQVRSRQFQLDRYRSLLAQVNEQLDKYSTYANTTISDRQRQLGRQGIRDAQTAIATTAGVTIRYDKLPVSATENMVGLAGDGSPLLSLLRDSFGLGAGAMLDKLAKGVAIGENPRVIARDMVRNGLSQSLNRMLTIARTETLRVYRESSREQYKESGVVPGYKRLATHDRRVCPACLMADGEFYKLTEVMPEHPQGRCAMVPIVDGYKPAEWQSGADWFTEQNPEVQQGILGNGRYQAWRAGKFDLDQLVAVRADRVWGDSLQPRTLTDLLGGSAKPYTIRTYEPPAIPKDGFPLDLAKLETVKTLGGSTGAMLVRDPQTGEMFVMKRGNNPGHLLEETYADAAYRALGIDVPEFKVYNQDGAPVKLAKFVEGTSLADLRTSDPKAYKKALKELQKGFAADALLGNWDVIGLSADNILIGKDGKVYRIDNGGSLRYRAQGALKTEFSKYVDEFWTLRDANINGQTAQVFGGLDYLDIVKQMKAIEKERGTLLDALPEELRAQVADRLDHLKDLTKIADTFKKDSFVESYIDIFSQHSTGIRKSGIADLFPETLTNKGVYVYDENGKQFDNLRDPYGGSIISKLSEYMSKNGGSHGIVRYWAQKQASDSWTNGAQAGKYFYAKQRGNFDLFWWKGGVDESKAHYEDTVSKVGPAYDKTMTMWHAFNYEFLRKTDFKNNDRKKGLVKLIRTENSYVMQMNNLKRGETGEIKRGAVESTSIYEKVTVFGTETTTQLVPHHRILGAYFFEQYPGSNSALFAGDGENEFVAMMDGLKVKYENK